jgi:pyruvate formate lyase activating enzyme
MKEAAYSTILENKTVRCELCPHHCTIRDGQRGICLTRENIGGTLIASNFYKPVSTAIDPMEKKPLFHFYPGSSIFSMGPSGCNFKCSFCQNCEISQRIVDSKEIPAQRLLRMIEGSGAIGVAYTYSEPAIWFEMIMELGPQVKARGLKNVMVSNGFIEERPLRDLLPIVDAMNIDIKSMNPDFYRRICKGSLEPVLKTCEIAKKAGCHLEITNLLIPEENDDPAETEMLATFIAEHLGKDTPLHISRYFPRFRMTHAPTPAATLETAWEIARKQLEFVYIGNRGAGEKEDTLCPKCGTILISRQGYRTQLSPTLKPNAQGKTACKHCGYPISIILP